MQSLTVTIFVTLALLASSGAEAGNAYPVQVGERPLYLVDQLPDSDLKQQLQGCTLDNLKPQPFSIAHRGAPLFYPEHSEASYLAAIRQGAGVIECDVTFTKDEQLVCRHSQCDLHQTTDILLRPELANRCSVPFSPFDEESGTAAHARCCTSDFTLAEIESLCAIMEGFDQRATTVEQFVLSAPDWRTQLHGQCERPMSHAASIELIDQFGLNMTPELKAPEIDMPFGDYSRTDFADALVQSYLDAGIAPERVFLQSFHLEDIQHWLEHWPEFAQQAIWLDGRYTLDGFDPQQPATWQISMDELYELGVRFIGPPLWMLVTADNDRIVPSVYAEHAQAAGLRIIAWTIERSGPLHDGGGWYYQSIAELTTNAGVVLQLLDVLMHQIGVEGVFSDWPATTTFFAHCMADTLVSDSP